jgi:hypothetical protein
MPRSADRLGLNIEGDRTELPVELPLQEQPVRSRAELYDPNAAPVNGMTRLPKHS